MLLLLKFPFHLLVLFSFQLLNYCKYIFNSALKINEVKQLYLGTIYNWTRHVRICVKIVIFEGLHFLLHLYMPKLIINNRL